MVEKENLSFEDAMEELEKILQLISAEKTSLDESIGLYARAAQLIKNSHEILARAQVRVEEINLDFVNTGDGTNI